PTPRHPATEKEEGMKMVALAMGKASLRLALYHEGLRAKAEALEGEAKAEALAELEAAAQPRISVAQTEVEVVRPLGKPLATVTGVTSVNVLGVEYPVVGGVVLDPDHTRKGEERSPRRLLLALMAWAIKEGKSSVRVGPFPAGTASSAGSALDDLAEELKK
ncbi:MAG: hypothetical protein ABIF09_18625, partial [Gemmatimonadota bacterium]